MLIVVVTISFPLSHTTHIHTYAISCCCSLSLSLSFSFNYYPSLYIYIYIYIYIVVIISLSLNYSRANGDIDRFDMSIKLVKSNGNYVGCKIIVIKTKEEILSFQFDNGVEIENVEILTRTDRPKSLPLHKENSNSKTSQATLFSNISNMRLYKLIQALKQRLMNRLI